MPEKIQTRPAKRVPKYDADTQLKMKIANNLEFNEKEQRSYDNMIKTWAILSENDTATAVKLVSEALGVSRRACYDWIRRAEDFFGELNVINKKAERVKQKIRLEAILHDKDPKIPLKDRLKAEELYMKLIGTAAEDEKKKLKNTMPLLGFVQTSTDPKALHPELEDKEIIEVNE